MGDKHGDKIQTVSPTTPVSILPKPEQTHTEPFTHGKSWLYGHLSGPRICPQATDTPHPPSHPASTRKALRMRTRLHRHLSETTRHTYRVVTVQPGQRPDKPNQQDLPALLSVSQAAKILGLSRASAYRYAAKGDLPVKRMGGRVFIITARLRPLLDGTEEMPHE
jgi:hypothetical protein